MLLSFLRRPLCVSRACAAPVRAVPHAAVPACAAARWRNLLIAAGLLLGLAGAAQAQVDIIQLRNRSAEELLPILRPMVEPGGALTGMQYQLILRASPANAADIRRMIASLDTRPRRLLISVRQEGDGEQAARSAGVGGRVILAPGASGANLEGRLQEERRSGSERISQQVQVIEGGIAAINVGQSLPVPGRVVTRTVNGVVVQDTTAYRDIGTGFQVSPRLNGERVTLEINPQREQAGPAGTVNMQRAYSTVSARLGEWVELAGSSSAESRSGAGLFSGGSTQRSEQRSIWVKVDELP